jgi:hypothetical protein
MTTTATFIKIETMLPSSFENHRKIFAHLKAAEKFLEVAIRPNPKKLAPLDVLK